MPDDVKRISVEVPREAYHEIQKAAKRRGVTVEVLARAVLNGWFLKQSTPTKKPRQRSFRPKLV